MTLDPKSLPNLTPEGLTAVDAVLAALKVPNDVREGVRIVGSLQAPVVAAVTALLHALDHKDEAEARKAYEAARRAMFVARQK